MSFYVLLFSNSTGLLFNDYIRVKLFERNSLKQLVTYTYSISNIGKENVWNQKSLQFVTSENQIKVNKK